MLRRLYDWTFSMAESPNALWALAAVSFIESSVFPITPLILLIPMVLARPDKAWLIAGVCTAASVAGGCLGWVIGYGFYESIGKPVLDFYGKAHAFEQISEQFRKYGAEAVLIAAITPFPYKVVTIASGAARLSIWVLIGASIVGRGIQFGVVTAILWKFGPPAREFIERRLGMIMTLGTIVLIGGFLALRYVF